MGHGKVGYLTDQMPDCVCFVIAAAQLHVGINVGTRDYFK